MVDVKAILSKAERGSELNHYLRSFRQPISKTWLFQDQCRISLASAYETRI